MCYIYTTKIIHERQGTLPNRPADKLKLLKLYLAIHSCRYQTCPNLICQLDIHPIYFLVFLEV